MQLSIHVNIIIEKKVIKMNDFNCVKKIDNEILQIADNLKIHN